MDASANALHAQRTTEGNNGAVGSVPDVTSPRPLLPKDHT